VKKEYERGIDDNGISSELGSSDSIRVFSWQTKNRDNGR
jgi:hypothetical protein